MNSRIALFVIAIAIVLVGAVSFFRKDSPSPQPGQAGAPTQGTGQNGTAIATATPAKDAKPGNASAGSKGRRTAARSGDEPVAEVVRNTGTASEIRAQPTEAPQPRQAAPPPRRVEAPAPGPRLPLAVSLFVEPTPTAAPREVAREEAGGGQDGRVRRATNRPFLPTGELLKCELVFAVTSDGSNGTETPLIGIVSEDKFFNGELVVPKGTKVHGTGGGLTGPTTARRLRTGSRWTVVYPRFGEVSHGAEMTVSGRALNRSLQAERGTWVITDGEAGLRGTAIYDAGADKIRMYLNTFAAAGLSTLQSTRESINALGQPRTDVASTPRNAALGGLSAVMAQEVAYIQEQIKANGAFIIVPGGTPFYLYLDESLVPSMARTGGVTRRPAAPEESEQVETPRRAAPAATPQPVPSAYGRGPNDFTQPAPDPASALARPANQRPPTTPSPN